MTADDIKALVWRLQKYCGTLAPPIARGLTHEAHRALTSLSTQVETLTLENQRLRVDAERYRWSTATEDNASALHSVLLCHAGDQAKIDERVDEYMKGERQ
jgi:hypothetical protein